MASPALGGDDQQASEAVENERHQEEHEAQFDQRAEVQIAGRFGELIRDHGSDRVTGRKQGSRDLGIISDDHGDGHRFAERTSESQKNRAHHAGARPGNDYLPSGFPASGAQRQRRFALLAWNGEQHFARDRNNEGNHHDRKDDAGGKKSDAVVWPGKKRQESERMFQSGTDRGTHQGHDHENSEQAIDDAGHGREQVDQERDSIAESSRRKLGQKDRRRQSQRHGDGKRHNRGDERAVNKRRSAVVIEDRVPDAGPEKAETEFRSRELRIHPQLVNQHGGEQKDDGGEDESQDVRHLIAFTQTANERTRSRFRRDRVLDRSGGRGHAIESEKWPSALWQSRA